MILHIIHVKTDQRFALANSFESQFLTKTYQLLSNYSINKVVDVTQLTSTEGGKEQSVASQHQHQPGKHSSRTEISQHQPPPPPSSFVVLLIREFVDAAAATRASYSTASASISRPRIYYNLLLTLLALQSSTIKRLVEEVAEMMLLLHA